MSSLLAYCRTGYEADTAKELAQRAGELNLYGYPQFNAGQGYVHYHLYNSADGKRLAQQLPLSSTVFPRQLVAVCETLDELDKADRITPIVDAVASLVKVSGPFGRLLVEHADTDAGRELAKFCRKFSVPLRQALRKPGLISQKENLHQACLHVFFTGFDQCQLGYSLAQFPAAFENGICRLKFPPAAPSRSTLKLEEAIVTMLDVSQRERVFRSGGRAVDLGACPGGWTYQLVQRGLFVEAIDNGLIDEALMATGQVQHFAADGFTYKPQMGRVDLLVCDMIEQPDRVAKLMGDWLVNHWADHAIFNLKLPMKKRYECVESAISQLEKRLQKLKTTFTLRVRHLYHNRDEVTVSVIRGEIE
ncbi:23S rRNA (cytidine(2498)-2'-O)-methyltransferase RlmM [Alteromonas aestuariivivens]|uniref:Ribosomal RNA large subunit methyltransferase M n=1 Tax=Alteromonas aestuariivivens TaxID=1938339 RepID=A0A3D8MC00_9ALTE|nr:23S rRNA (cytidine(2498)-2'-O)-methyltransferase RlmM [Alteromonas aestuariivivens]RDV27566.1 23S rRNA (cytidine(2498)-2'-O)-methyltransferase RlmM [Alteromonas aestuariivivens]